MIIPNKFIKLDYNPATDVLIIEWPNIHDYTIPELKFILNEIVSTIRNYDIKKVLADSTKSVVTLPDTEYKSIIEQLTKDLMNTRLQKFARLTTGQGYREQAANTAAEALKNYFAVRNFHNMDEALEWLST